ncbi:HIT family protein [Candidatus Woesearchaeota archaeon]|nr:HIT family protein [Candidatus Woesearchaeota archaeon]
MADCIFCKIAKKQISSDIVYEDKKILAFLDNRPASLGHTLVVPKTHAETLDKLDEDSLKSLILSVQKVSKAISKFSQGYNVIQNNKEVAGQIVHHIHFHVVPRNDGDGIRWNRPNPVFSEKEIKNVIEKIKSNLNL